MTNTFSVGYDAPSPHLTDGGYSNEFRADKLLRALKLEEHDALGFHQSEIVSQQIEALQRYFGELYGDEEDGRSSVTTREIYEIIQWTLPDLLRVFSSGGNIVSLEANSPENEQKARDAADYLYWIFFADNKGFNLLHDFAFDGMLHRTGYLACYWRDAEYQAPQHMTGLDMMGVMTIANDPQCKIIAQNLDDTSEVGGYSLIVQRLKSPARAEIVSIAPEDMRLNGRAISLDRARYVGRVMRMLRGEAARLWPDKEEEIYGASAASATADGNIRRSDDVRQERFQDDRNDYKTPSDPASTEIEVLEEYIRLDLNEDGYPEIIRSYRIQNTILEEEEVEENPFATWSYRPVPHRFMGLSVHDVANDLQRQSTVVTRAGLDALYQGVVMREAYDINTVDVDALLATHSGAKVGVNGPPGDKIMPLTSNNASIDMAWNALEVIKQRLEDRVGASRQTRGLDSDALTDSHSGVALQKLQLNADAQKEMTARHMADGLSTLFSKLYRLVCRNQNQPRAAKVGGKWAQFDPRTWNSDLEVSVYAGGVNREHTMAGLAMIGAEMDKVFQALGPSNPICTAKNRYQYEEELCRHAGFKTAALFFTEPPDVPVTDPQTGQPVVDPQTGQPKMQPWQPPPQPDPAMAKVHADTQANAAKLASDNQIATNKHNLDVGRALSDHQLATDEAALKLQLMRDESAERIRLMEQEQAMKERTAQMQMDADERLAVMKMEMEERLEYRRIDMQERVGKAKASASGVGSSGSEAPSVDTDVNGQ